MSTHLAKPEHEIAYHDLCEFVRKHADLTSLELLAVAANMVGKLIALQDQRAISPSLAMELVAKNIEHGNKQVIDQLARSQNNGFPT